MRRSAGLLRMWRGPAVPSSESLLPSTREISRSQTSHQALADRASESRRTSRSFRGGRSGLAEGLLAVVFSLPPSQFNDVELPNCRLKVAVDRVRDSCHMSS